MKKKTNMTKHIVVIRQVEKEIVSTPWLWRFNFVKKLISFINRKIKPRINERVTYNAYETDDVGTSNVTLNDVDLVMIKTNDKPIYLCGKNGFFINCRIVSTELKKVKKLDLSKECVK